MLRLVLSNRKATNRTKAALHHGLIKERLLEMLLSLLRDYVMDFSSLWFLYVSLVYLTYLCHTSMWNMGLEALATISLKYCLVLDVSGLYTITKASFFGGEAVVVWDNSRPMERKALNGLLCKWKQMPPWKRC